MDPTELRRRFDHLTLTEDKKKQRDHRLVEYDLSTAAINLNDILPDGREKSLVITKLEEAAFWAHGAIARQEDSE